MPFTAKISKKIKDTDALYEIKGRITNPSGLDVEANGILQDNGKGSCSLVLNDDIQKSFIDGNQVKSYRSISGKPFVLSNYTGELKPGNTIIFSQFSFTTKTP